MKPANETDVREEIAVPLLSLLGYQRGTENEILREFSISYNRNFLGRKKKNDPPLRGRADYVLSVAAAGRWTLEIKAPSEDITPDAIDQAISYARHPEVSGSYAAVLNGKRFVIVHNSQRSTDAPILDVSVTSPAELATKVENILSPAAIRRDCSPPVVDLGKSLAPGLRSSANMTGGTLTFQDFAWGCNYALPGAQTAELDKLQAMMRGYQTTVSSGRVWRDEQSRVKATLQWALPHVELVQFALDKKIMDAQFVSLDETISTDPQKQTVFDVVHGFVVREGETIYDILRWKSATIGAEVSITYRGQAVGHIAGTVFAGSFQIEQEATSPWVADLLLQMYGAGTFELHLDPR